MATTMRRSLVALALATATPLAASPPSAAAEAEAGLRRAEIQMLVDAPAAIRTVEAALAAASRARNPALSALCEHRLALVRALGGDRAGQLRAMADAAFRLHDLAATASERSRAAQALIVTASFAMNTGDAALTDRARDVALALLTRSDIAHDASRAEALRVAGDVFVFQNRPAEALAWSDRAVAAYDALGGNEAGLVYALARRGSALQRLSRYPEALAAFRRAVAVADRGGSNDPTVAPLALRALGFYYMRLDKIDLALPLFQRALVEAEKLPPGFPYAGGLTRDIMQALISGERWAEARGYAQTTANRARATLGAESYDFASATLVLARIDTRLGRFDAAAERIDEAEAIMARGLVADNRRRWEPLAARAALLAARGQGDAAAALYARADAIVADLPRDDPDRINLAVEGAGAQLSGGHPDAESWRIARGAADAVTTRIVAQATTDSTIDIEPARTARIYGVALDTAWTLFASTGLAAEPTRALSARAPLPVSGDAAPLR